MSFNDISLNIILDYIYLNHERDQLQIKWTLILDVLDESGFFSSILLPC